MTIENKYLKLSVLLTCICMVIILLSCSCDGPPPPSKSWKVIERGSIVEVAYGSETDFPQYAALHLESGYFRMNYGPGSGWGTSVILLPSFWEKGIYYQGALFSNLKMSLKQVPDRQKV